MLLLSRQSDIQNFTEIFSKKEKLLYVHKSAAKIIKIRIFALPPEIFAED